MWKTDRPCDLRVLPTLLVRNEILLWLHDLRWFRSKPARQTRICETTSPVQSPTAGVDTDISLALWSGDHPSHNPDARRGANPLGSMSPSLLWLSSSCALSRSAPQVVMSEFGTIISTGE